MLADTLKDRPPLARLHTGTVVYSVVGVKRVKAPRGTGEGSYVEAQRSPAEVSLLRPCSHVRSLIRGAFAETDRSFLLCP